MEIHMQIDGYESVLQRKAKTKLYVYTVYTYEHLYAMSAKYKVIC